MSEILYLPVLINEARECVPHASCAGQWAVVGVLVAQC